MNEGRYAEAIPVLEQARREETDERLESYTHYLSGLACLYEARTEIFGRVISFNEERLTRAIDHLESVADRSASGRVLEDAYWFLGKAYLMKGEPTRAIRALTECQQVKGRRAAEARELIQAIEEIG
jgi:tetratricopeptide (TPR) repeat protein